MILINPRSTRGFCICGTGLLLLLAVVNNQLQLRRTLTTVSRSSKINYFDSEQTTDSIAMVASNLSLLEPPCSCCGSTKPFRGFNKRKNARCDTCNALERHRKLCHIFGTSEIRAMNMPLLKKPSKIIYFGPHPTHYKFFSARPDEYIFHPVDFFAKGYHYPPGTQFADTTNLSQYTDGAFDVIISMHVLEHVPNLFRAF